jgi:glycosyltransferase involved in cell wall biosynthesis
VELSQGSGGVVERAHVCVCICTFKRPGLLATLLQKLEQQQLENELTMSVVVADNDKHRSGEASVSEARARGRLAIVYCVEPEQNIAKARNAALRHAKGEYLAFIDDDEVPDDQWLANAVRFCRAAGVDGMLGPVRPYFQHQPPAWLTKGRFCDRPEPATGHVLPWSSTTPSPSQWPSAPAERTMSSSSGSSRAAPSCSGATKRRCTSSCLPNAAGADIFCSERCVADRAKKGWPIEEASPSPWWPCLLTR